MDDVLLVLGGLATGVGLAAASGLRVFLPAFLASLALRFELLPVSESVGWLGHDGAVLGLGVATMLELVAYYVPWLDNLLDSIATPAAVVAGVLVSAATFVGLPEHLQWTAAIVLGGGAAGTVQLGTVATRALSSATTGGLGNPLVATAENAGASFLTLLALVLPFLALALVVALLVLAFRRVRRWRRRRPADLEAVSAGRR
ncbi:MAG: DUF4126 domain-containing protein [Myxococcota bacterium]